MLGRCLSAACDDFYWDRHDLPSAHTLTTGLYVSTDFARPSDRAPPPGSLSTLAERMRHPLVIYFAATLRCYRNAP